MALNGLYCLTVWARVPPANDKEHAEASAVPPERPKSSQLEVDPMHAPCTLHESCIGAYARNIFAKGTRAVPATTFVHACASRLPVAKALHASNSVKQVEEDPPLAVQLRLKATPFTSMTANGPASRRVLSPNDVAQEREPFPEKAKCLHGEGLALHIPATLH